MSRRKLPENVLFGTKYEIGSRCVRYRSCRGVIKIGFGGTFRVNCDGRPRGVMGTQKKTKLPLHHVLRRGPGRGALRRVS